MANKEDILMKLVDYDIDFKSLFADFPENETDGYIYVRGSRKRDEYAITQFMVGNRKMLTNILYAAAHNDSFREACYNAVLGVLEQHPEEMDMFLEQMNIVAK